MFAYNCTCNAARRLVTAQQRHLSSTATRIQQQVSSSSSKGKGSSRLEWDPANKQWIKKDSTVRAVGQQRPSPAERAKILQELKEQRLNEVTELSPAGNDAVAATVKDANAATSTSDGASGSSSSPEGGSTVSSSGRRYRRGQDSSTLAVSFAIWSPRPVPAILTHLTCTHSAGSNSDNIGRCTNTDSSLTTRKYRLLHDRMSKMRIRYLHRRSTTSFRSNG